MLSNAFWHFMIGSFQLLTPMLIEYGHHQWVLTNNPFNILVDYRYVLCTLSQIPFSWTSQTIHSTLHLTATSPCTWCNNFCLTVSLNVKRNNMQCCKCIFYVDIFFCFFWFFSKHRINKLRTITTNFLLCRQFLIFKSDEEYL